MHYDTDVNYMVTYLFLQEVSFSALNVWLFIIAFIPITHLWLILFTINHPNPAPNTLSLIFLQASSVIVSSSSIFFGICEQRWTYLYKTPVTGERVPIYMSKIENRKWGSHVLFLWLCESRCNLCLSVYAQRSEWGWDQSHGPHPCFFFTSDVVNRWIGVKQHHSFALPCVRWGPVDKSIKYRSSHKKQNKYIVDWQPSWYFL